MGRLNVNDHVNPVVVEEHQIGHVCQQVRHLQVDLLIRWILRVLVEVRWLRVHNDQALLSNRYYVLSYDQGELGLDETGKGAILLSRDEIGESDKAHGESEAVGDQLAVNAEALVVIHFPLGDVFRANVHLIN